MPTGAYSHHGRPWLIESQAQVYAPAPTKASVANEYSPAVPSTSDHIRLIAK